MNKVLYCRRQYYAIYMPEHHRAHKDGYVYEHVLIAEYKLQRPLKAQEVVHHLDGNKLNNSPENIVVLKNKADHALLHKLIDANRFYQLLEDDDGTVVIIYDKPTCIKCGNPLSGYRAHYCQECARKMQRKVLRPSRDVLKIDIRTTPFTTLAAKYHVSDKAIRKWCKYYHLPYKRSEIQQLSDIQWNAL
ncbi:HNH endonuclease [Butyrivibrio sp.]|uniref:HNH endonuclease n=1 Tax=Butyrivibrio sp. TaxID=28121 RepID=UPI0025C2FF72|nr:HNH endonuclease [Butyrivibrio sp.]MBQ7431270.1 HNH endonuclease [Butyrivibrio sp.]MBQ9303485.1 HNH endonuclease [Butyrivibrio sp.]